MANPGETYPRHIHRSKMNPAPEDLNFANLFRDRRHRAVLGGKIDLTGHSADKIGSQTSVTFDAELGSAVRYHKIHGSA